MLSRLKQLLHWCGDDFDGCIIFDECHKAKNLCPTGAGKPTKTGQTVLELQNKLPKARVVYASATGMFFFYIYKGSHLYFTYYSFCICERMYVCMCVRVRFMETRFYRSGRAPCVTEARGEGTDVLKEKILLSKAIFRRLISFVFFNNLFFFHRRQ